MLEAADGNRFAAFRGDPGWSSDGAGVVLLPDVRGLYRFYEELALRFAERGSSRGARLLRPHGGRGKRDDDFEYMEHVAAGDAGAACGGRRRCGRAPPCSQVCVPVVHGRLLPRWAGISWLAAARQHGLAGAIGFYGRPGLTQDGAPGPSSVPEARRRRSSR